MYSAHPALDFDRFAKSTLEAFVDAPIGSCLALVQREGQILIYSPDDETAGRPAINHVVTPGDLETVGQLLAPE